MRADKQHNAYSATQVYDQARSLLRAFAYRLRSIPGKIRYSFPTVQRIAGDAVRTVLIDLGLRVPASPASVYDPASVVSRGPEATKLEATDPEAVTNPDPEGVGRPAKAPRYSSTTIIPNSAATQKSITLETLRQVCSAISHFLNQKYVATEGGWPYCPYCHHNTLQYIPNGNVYCMQCNWELTREIAAFWIGCSIVHDPPNLRVPDCVSGDCLCGNRAHEKDKAMLMILKGPYFWKKVRQIRKRCPHTPVKHCMKLAEMSIRSEVMIERMYLKNGIRRGSWREVALTKRESVLL